MRRVFALFGTIALDGMNTVNKQLTGLDKTLKTASKQLAKTGRQIEKLGTTFSKSFTAPIIAGTGAITLLAKKTGEYADHLLDLEQITGLSTDSLQELDHVSKIAGVSFDGLTGIVSKFTNQLPEIERGGNAASRAFSQLGVSMKNADGTTRSMNEMFFDIIEALREVENVTDRNALAQDIFGRSLTDLAPVLGMTADEFRRTREEAHETGLVMSKDALLSANEFRKEMEKLGEQFAAAGRNIAVDFIPVLRDTIIPAINNKFIPALRDGIEWLRSTIKWFTDLDPAVKGAALKFIGITAAIGPFLIIVGKAMRALAGLRATILLVNSALLTNPWGIAILGITALTAAIIKIKSKQDDYNESIEENIDLLKEQQRTAQYDPVINALEEIVLLYKALGPGGLDPDSILGKNTLKRIKELEASIGKGFAGGFTYRMNQATESLEKFKKMRDDVSNLSGTPAKSNATDLSEEELEKRIEILEEEIQEEEKINAEMERMDAKLQESKRQDMERLKQESIAWDQEQLEKERKSNEEKKRLHEEELRRIETEKQKRIEMVAVFADLQNQHFDIISGFYDNKALKIENDYQLQKKSIENSALSEEQKAAKMRKLDEDTDKAKRKLARKQAKLEKVQGIFSVGISTAMGIMKAIADLGPIAGAIMAGVVGAIGAAQAAIIAAKPLPLATGGLVTGGRGGTFAQIGEGREDELVLPMKTGVDALVDRMFERSAELGGRATAAQLPVAPSQPGYVDNRTYKFDVGNFVGNRAAMKELARTIMEFTGLEQTRIGAMT